VTSLADVIVVYLELGKLFGTFLRRRDAKRLFVVVEVAGVAGTSYGPVFVCVCLSQVGVLSKRLNESSWILAWELHSTYPTLCYKEIHVPSKIRVLPSGILLQTLDLKILPRHIDHRSMLT